MNLSGRLVIVGCGLIGGSVAAGVRDSGFAGHIVGVDAARPALERGIAAGLFDETGMPRDPGPDDLILLSAPPLACVEILRELATMEPFAGGAVVTDTASVKAPVLAAFEGAAVPERFVAGHPIAGSERSGITAARAGLFRDHRVVLTPEAGTETHAIERVRGLWESLGAAVVEMDVQQHDEVLAMTSHLPHLLAFALVETLGDQERSEQVFSLAAGGFRDFTRIASSDPDMWADVFSSNGAAVRSILGAYVSVLKALDAELASGDRARLRQRLEHARELRERWLATMPNGAGGNAS